jgi:transposase
MPKKIEGADQKIWFMIDNWHKFSMKELSEKLEVSPVTVSQWAKRCREKGIDLPKRQRYDRIKWNDLVEKFKNKNK